MRVARPIPLIASALLVSALALVLVLRFVVFSPSNAQAATTLLTVVAGDVSVQTSGRAEPRTAVDGETLHEGDRIITGDDGRAVVTFFEGSTEVLEPSTEITIERIASTAGDGLLASISQGVGTTWNTVFNTSDTKAQYEIKTKAVVAAVRDTMFLVQVDASGKTTVWSRQGTVAVTAGGVETLVHEGTRSTTVPGSEPGVPEAFAPPNGELKITLASSAWLLIVSPDGLASGLAPAGMPVNQIPLGVIAEPGVEPQALSLMTMSDGAYELHFTGKESGDFHLTIEGTTEGRVTCDARRVGSASQGQKFVGHLVLRLEDGALAGCDLSEIVETDEASTAKFIIPDQLVRAVQSGRTLWPQVSVLGNAVTPTGSAATSPAAVSTQAIASPSDSAVPSGTTQALASTPVADSIGSTPVPAAAPAEILPATALPPAAATNTSAPAPPPSRTPNPTTTPVSCPPHLDGHYVGEWTRTPSMNPPASGALTADLVFVGGTVSGTETVANSPLPPDIPLSGSVSCGQIMWTSNVQFQATLTGTISSDGSMISGTYVAVGFDPGTFTLSLQSPTPTSTAPTDTPSPTSMSTPVPTATITPVLPTSTATSTATATAANTATNTPTQTNTPVPTATNTPSATPTSSPTATDTALATPTNTPSPTSTNTSVPTATITP
ncbi:MAG: FecR domain-containing protein, partial [Chloroflexota bacterium]|nr:FecR domain-containing protein [Chloroflexota bacterium]